MPISFPSMQAMGQGEASGDVLLCLRAVSGGKQVENSGRHLGGKIFALRLAVHPVHISVRRLYSFGKRREPWEVLTAKPAMGWLLLEWNEIRHYRTARLISRAGEDMAPMLIYAKIEQCLGPRGMLVEGIEPRQRGSKHMWKDQQAWWCHAPPRPDPFRTLEQMVGSVDVCSSLYDELEVRMGQT